MKPSLFRVRRVIALASVAGIVALATGGVALAQQSANAPQADAGGHHAHGQHKGIVAQALALQSLTDDQRAAIERLVQTRHAAEVPVKHADAKVLTDLSTQVEQASLDRPALAPDIQARDGAAAAAQVVDRRTLQQLHDLLTPAQRNELADAVEASGPAHAWQGHAHHGEVEHLGRRLGLTDQQVQQIVANLHAEHAGHTPDGGHRGARGERQAWLASFRTDTFNANAGPRHDGSVRREEHMENLMQAVLPVLTPAQRAQLAAHLRQRAARESQA